MTPKEKKKKWAPLAAQEAWQLPKWRISSDAKQTKSRVTVLHGARHRIMQPKPKCRNQRRKNHTLDHNVKRESELKPQALLRRCVVHCSRLVSSPARCFGNHFPWSFEACCVCLASRGFGSCRSSHRGVTCRAFDSQHHAPRTTSIFSALSLDKAWLFSASNVTLANTPKALTC